MIKNKIKYIKNANFSTFIFNFADVQRDPFVGVTAGTVSLGVYVFIDVEADGVSLNQMK